MRLWAAIESITFDELAPHLGDQAEVAFGITKGYVNRSGELDDWLIELSVLGDRGLVQFPELGRTMTAMTGSLRQSPRDERCFFLDSRFTVGVFDRTSQTKTAMDDADGAPVAVFGSLSVTGSELGSWNAFRYSVLVRRLQSFCLRSKDPRFGHWFDVARYADLGSDPDIISAPVCVAELEIDFS